jgi:hypothetical protein
MEDTKDNAEAERPSNPDDGAVADATPLRIRIKYVAPGGGFIGWEDDVQRLLEERNRRICEARGITREQLERVRALRPACMSGDVEQVRELLGSGIDPNEHGDIGETLLMVTARRGHTDVVQCLIEFDARPDAVDYLGWTAVDYAVEGGHLDLAEFLRALLSPPTTGPN